jgi:hypothetical protein
LPTLSPSRAATIVVGHGARQPTWRGGLTVYAGPGTLVSLKDVVKGTRPHQLTTVGLCHSERGLHVRWDCFDAFDPVTNCLLCNDPVWPPYKQNAVEVFLGWSGIDEPQVWIALCLTSGSSVFVLLTEINVQPLYLELEFSPHGVPWMAHIDNPIGNCSGGWTTSPIECAQSGVQG